MDSTEEESILQRFKRNYPEFPEGNIIHPDKPDFIIQGVLTVGIELTQVFKDQDSLEGSLLKAKETFKRKVLSFVTLNLNSSSFPKCIINIEFNDDKYSKKLNAKNIGELCYNDILLKLNGITNEVVGDYEIENNGELPEIISSYSIWVDKDLEETEYVETASSLGNPLTNYFIQFILDKKEKAKEQFSKCALYWLIIKEGSFEADYFGQIQVDKMNLSTTFDKVFILRQFNSEIIELK